MLSSFDVRDRFGVNWAWSWFEKTPWEKRNELTFLMRGAGIGHLRSSIWPDTWVAGTDTYNWIAGDPYSIHDASKPDPAGFLDRLSEVGIKFLFSIGEPWQGMLNGSVDHDVWRGSLAKQIDTIARRYRDVCVGLEAPNEYDNPSATSPNVIQPWDDNLRDWINRAGALWQGDARVNNLPFLAPSFVHGQPSAQELGNMSAVLDAHNLHPYSGNHVYLGSWLDAAKVAMNPMLSSGAPAWATEFGVWPTVAGQPAPDPGWGWGSISEQQAAVLTLKQYLTHLDKGVVRSYVYALVDHWQQFGLVRNDMSVRPAYNAVKKLMSLCDDAKPAGAGTALAYTITNKPADLKELAVWRADGSHVLYLWREASLGVAPVTVHLSFPNDHHLVSHDLVGGDDCPKDQAGGFQYDLVIADDPIGLEVRPG